MLELFRTIPSDWIDAVGVAGFGLYVLNYALLTFRKIGSETITFFTMNWLAATFVLIGLTASFNLASALIQVFWIVISTIAIIIRLRQKTGPQTHHNELNDKLTA